MAKKKNKTIKESNINDVSVNPEGRLDPTKDFVRLARIGGNRQIVARTPDYISSLRNGLSKVMLNLGDGEKRTQPINLTSGVGFLNETMGELLKRSVPSDNKGIISEIIQGGTGIPYYGSLIGNMAVNPSTVDPHTFRKMAETDDDIAFALQFNIDSIVNSVGKFMHENAEIQESVRHTIETINGGFDRFIQNVCTGFIYGFSVLSFTWDYDPVVSGYTIKEALPLPQSAIIFSVNGQGYIEEDGVGQFVYNATSQNLANSVSRGWGGHNNLFGGSSYGSEDFGYDTYAGEGDVYAAAGDLEYPYRLPYYANVGLVWLPKTSTLVYSHFGVAAQMNPYGKSVLRSVYNLWLQKLVIQQIRTYALDKRAFPLMVVYCDSRVPMANQTPTTGINQETPMTVLEYARGEVGEASTLSTIFLPKDCVEVDTVRVEGDISLLDAIEGRLKSSISKALGVPEGLSQGGDSSSYAAATRHGMTNSLFVAARRREIVNCVVEEFVRPVIGSLFPPSVHEGKWGRFESELLTQDEKIKNSQLHKLNCEGGLANIKRLADINKARESVGNEAIKEKEFPQYLIDIESQLQQNQPQMTEGRDLTGDNYSHDKARQSNA